MRTNRPDPHVPTTSIAEAVRIRRQGGNVELAAHRITSEIILGARSSGALASRRLDESISFLLLARLIASLLVRSEALLALRPTMSSTRSGDAAKFRVLAKDMTTDGDLKTGTAPAQSSVTQPVMATETLLGHDRPAATPAATSPALPSSLVERAAETFSLRGISRPPSCCSPKPRRPRAHRLPGLTRCPAARRSVF